MAIEHSSPEQQPPQIPKEIHDLAASSVLYRFDKQVDKDPTRICTLAMWRHKATTVHALSIAPEELGNPLVDHTLLQLLLGSVVETGGEKRYVPRELDNLIRTISDPTWVTRLPSWSDLRDRPGTQMERVSILTLANYRTGKFDPTTPEADESLERIVERGIRTDRHNTFILGANGACVDYEVSLDAEGPHISCVMLADAESLNPYGTEAGEFARRHREWLWTVMMFTGFEKGMKYL